MAEQAQAMNHEQVIADTRDWVVKAVIGLNLCPFAKAVHVNERIRYVVSDATEPEALLKDLARELLALNRADPEEIDTTLLIHPGVLTDFLEFNDFLDAADALGDAGLAGDLEEEYRADGLGLQHHRADEAAHQLVVQDAVGGEGADKTAPGQGQQMIPPAEDPDVVAVDLLLHPEGVLKVRPETGLEGEQAPDARVAEHPLIADHHRPPGQAPEAIGQTQIFDGAEGGANRLAFMPGDLECLGEVLERSRFPGSHSESIPPQPLGAQSKGNN